MVNKERVALWVQALHDPSLVQGYGKLARQTSDGKWAQCCLDVACQVAKASGLPLTEILYQSESDNIRLRGYVTDDINEYNILPDAVRDWYGFTSHEVAIDAVDSDGMRAELPHNGVFATWLNDKAGLSFTEIAARIEATYLQPKGEQA